MGDGNIKDGSFKGKILSELEQRYLREGIVIKFVKDISD